MNTEKHEIIEYSPHIPIKFFVERLGYVPRHWHSSIELSMVLDGTVSVTEGEEHWEAGPEDIFLINQSSFHEVKSENAVMVTIQIDLSRLPSLTSEDREAVFLCNSAADRNPSRYDGLRFGLARLVRENSHHSDGVEYRNLSLAYYLISELLQHFKVKDGSSLRQNRKQIDRMNRIQRYISEHYADNLSLSMLAEEEGLSVPYLSSFFDKYMGMKFSEYYTSVRLSHAEELLLRTGETVEEIAVRSGFNDAHSFIRSFKKEFGLTPSAYRREAPKERRKREADSSLNYLLLEPGNYLHLLNKYLPKEDSSLNLHREEVSLSVLDVPSVQIHKKGERLRHTFRNFLCVGKAKDLLNEGIREMIRDIQRNIGYRYVKFHGILSDDMMVVNRVNGKLRFHYTLVDQALDFLLEEGLKPLIQLSFMPAELAEDPNKTVFQVPHVTSPPRAMYEWEDLVTDFTKHLLHRYGKEEVLSWLFSVWNEPMTGVSMFGFGDDHRFFRFYAATCHAVKAVCPEISFGSPSMLYIENLGGEGWIRDFCRYAEKHDAVPDFLNVHYYADIFPDTVGENHFLGMKPSSSFPKRSDDFSLWIGSVKRIFASLGLKEKPVYLTEWNFTFSHRNLINDTCFKSCYIMKNLLKNYDRLESFGYWSLTDLLEEHALPDILFHGGLGIYTMDGLRKNVFYAFYFARRLGDELLSFGDGWFVTRGRGSIQIITYHYVHYGNLFASGEMFDITDTHRYTPFDMSKKLRIRIPLEGFSKGNLEIKEYFVNRRYGSAYDIWVSLGASPMDPEDAKLFKGLCTPGYHKEIRLLDSSGFTYEAELDPLEIRLAEISLKQI